MLLKKAENIANLKNNESSITVTDLGDFFSYFNHYNLFNNYNTKTNTQWCNNNNNKWIKLTIKLRKLQLRQRSRQTI